MKLTKTYLSQWSTIIIDILLSCSRILCRENVLLFQLLPTDHAKVKRFDNNTTIDGNKFFMINRVWSKKQWFSTIVFLIPIRSTVLPSVFVRLVRTKNHICRLNQHHIARLTGWCPNDRLLYMYLASFIQCFSTWNIWNSQNAFAKRRVDRPLRTICS